MKDLPYLACTVSVGIDPHPIPLVFFCSIPGRLKAYCCGNISFCMVNLLSPCCICRIFIIHKIIIVQNNLPYTQYTTVHPFATLNNLCTNLQEHHSDFYVYHTVWLVVIVRPLKAHRTALPYTVWTSRYPYTKVNLPHRIAILHKHRMVKLTHCMDLVFYSTISLVSVQPLG